MPKKQRKGTHFFCDRQKSIYSLTRAGVLIRFVFLSDGAYNMFFRSLRLSHGWRPKGNMPQNLPWSDLMPKASRLRMPVPVCLRRSLSLYGLCGQMIRGRGSPHLPLCDSLSFGDWNKRQASLILSLILSAIPSAKSGAHLPECRHASNANALCLKAVRLFVDTAFLTDCPLSMAGRNGPCPFLPPSLRRVPGP